MGGLAVLFLLGLYFILAVMAIVKTKPLWAKALVLLAALLIPTADAVYGRYKLKQMCATEAGLKVYKVAHNVEGFMGYADEEMITKYGYQFVESERTHGKYYRVSLSNGYIVTDENVTPKSIHRFRLVRDFEMLNYNKKQSYSRNQEIIENIATSEVLATYTHLAFTGGWAESPGNVAWCSTEPFLNKPYVDPIKLLITSTLKHSGE